MVDQDGRLVRCHVATGDALYLLDRSEVCYDVRTVETTQYDGTVESTVPLIVLGVEVGGGGPAAHVELGHDQAAKAALMLLQARDTLGCVEGAGR